MMQRVRLGMDARGVYVSGWDQPSAALHAGGFDQKYIVLKVPGHKYWSARAEQSYAPAEFQIFERIADDPGWWTKTITFPVTAKEAK